MSSSETSFNSSKNISSISTLINDLTSETHLFLSPNSDLSQKALSLSDQLYTFVSSQELPFSLSENIPENTTGFKFGLEKLILEGFDSDQIWQQIELRNQPFFKNRSEPVIRDLLGDVFSDNELSDIDSDGSLNEPSDSEKVENLSDEEPEDLQEEVGEDMAIEDKDTVSEYSSSEKSEQEQSIDTDADSAQEDQADASSDEERTEVDDDFFSLNKMHKMIDAAEEAEFNEESEKESEEEIDLNQDPDEMDSDSAPIDEVKFGDFFKESSQNKKSQRKVRFAEADSSKNANKPNQLFEESDDEDIDTGSKPSKFEQKQLKMAKMIEQLEDENVSAKPWTLMGEAAAWNRPKDSLLEEDLEFDHASKPAPVVTVEVTQGLEELIQQRIINLQFDDVVKPLKEKMRPQFDSSDIELSMEKSKKSLAEVYEDEYQKATTVSKSEELSPEVAKAHEEIEALFLSVSAKLDALSNSHYAPKMAKIEVQVVKDLPAIAMEEAIPVAVSDATLLAPEEVYAQEHRGQAGVIQSKQELSPEERKRLRNRKKRLAKIRSKNTPTAPAQVAPQKS